MDSYMQFLLVGSVLMFVSVLASKTSIRFGIPTLLIFIGVGMLAGSDGVGGIYFNDPSTAQNIGIVALNFILFSGGMDTKGSDIKPIAKTGLMLSTVGVLITTLLSGTMMWILSDQTIPIYEAMMLGAIISSTDAAAIFTLFRTKQAHLKHGIRPILEFESGSNDPMAYFLTISLLFLVNNPHEGFLQMIPIFFKGMAIGAAVGFGMGKAAVWVMRNVNLTISGLYPVLMISMAIFTNALAETFSGNGFLAVYLAGIVVGNSQFVHKNIVTQFYDGITWMMQIIMFLLLGLLAFPSKLPSVALSGIAIAFFVMFIARPATVFACTIRSKMTIKDKLFLSWGGLRGASPIIFATYPMVEGIRSASVIFHVVFFVTIFSVAIQGSTLIWVGKKLGVLKSKD